MGTSGAPIRRDVISAGGFLPAVKAAMAMGHLQAQGVASWDGNPQGRDSIAGSVRSMTARPDAQKHQTKLP
ncbi:TPA: hypothetical protein ACHJX8_004465 [Yersinia enterocolitica]|uniref:hypothetical protein n=1 Tax=Yersinia massiliensis TaxID=419257 RepID=UPI00030904A1|nr:hypothetical protein [Yersinia massiliensis]QKJ09321.1 hypothetical protein HRD68_00455 [Yersinia massiliensis]